MAIKKRTPEPEEAWKLDRPTGGPRGALRRWYEDAVIRETRRVPCGTRAAHMDNWERETLRFAEVARSLSVDPVAVLLDATVTALYHRCGPRSPAGRKPDLMKWLQDEHAVAVFRALVSASRAAAAARRLPRAERIEAMVAAVAANQVRRTKSEDAPGRPANSLEKTRKWFTVKTHFLEALLAEHAPSRRTAVATWEHEEIALKLMELDGFPARDTDAMERLRKDVADRSSISRRRARAVAAAFAPKSEADSGE